MYVCAANCSAAIFHRDTGVLCFLTKSSTLEEARTIINSVLSFSSRGRGRSKFPPLHKPLCS